MSVVRAVRHLATVDESINRASTRRFGQARAAWTTAALLSAIAAFHVAVAMGAPWGELTRGGGTSATLTTSGRIVAAMSCVLAIVMAGAILGRAGQGPLRKRSPRVTTVLAWFTTVYALLLGLVTFVMVTSRHNDAPPH